MKYLFGFIFIFSFNALSQSNSEKELVTKFEKAKNINMAKLYLRELRCSPKSLTSTKDYKREDIYFQFSHSGTLKRSKYSNGYFSYGRTLQAVNGELQFERYSKSLYDYVANLFGNGGAGDNLSFKVKGEGDLIYIGKIDKNKNSKMTDIYICKLVEGDSIFTTSESHYEGDRSTIFENAQKKYDIIEKSYKKNKVRDNQ
jgi:hypothetical protein